MRNFIAGTMSVLGILLILAGAGVIILPALPKRGASAAKGDFVVEGATTVDRGTGAERAGRGLSLLGAPERLIGWGILLLVIASIAAGAIGFNLSATAQAK